jgi:hypothetical protein
LIVLPADKGKAAVIIDSIEYKAKIKNMLKDKRVYQKLNKDPSPGFKRQLISHLTKLRDDGKITKEQYWHLYPTSDMVPRLYGSPKIHKEGAPLRPIVDYTGSMAYNTSKAIADLLKPLIGRTKYHVKNTVDFSKDIQTLHLEDDEIMNSHDVVSLFTNVPLKDAMDVIRKRLLADTTLFQRTNLLVDDIMTLLDFVLATTYFQFDGEIYQQVFGAPMGSPVSVAVSDLYMEDLEERAMDTAPPETKPKIWKRYIDDSFEIVKRDQRD